MTVDNGEITEPSRSSDDRFLKRVRQQVGWVAGGITVLGILVNAWVSLIVSDRAGEQSQANFIREQSPFPGRFSSASCSTQPS